MSQSWNELLCHWRSGYINRIIDELIFVVTYRYFRTMLRGIATAGCLSVCLSVRLSVTSRYRDHIGWNSPFSSVTRTSLVSLLSTSPIPSHWLATALLWWNDGCKLHFVDCTSLKSVFTSRRGEATAVPTVNRRRVGMGRFMIFWQAVAGWIETVQMCWNWATLAEIYENKNPTQLFRWPAVSWPWVKKVGRAGDTVIKFLTKF